MKQVWILHHHEFWTSRVVKRLEEKGLQATIFPYFEDFLGSEVFVSGQGILIVRGQCMLSNGSLLSSVGHLGLFKQGNPDLQIIATTTGKLFHDGFLESEFCDTALFEGEDSKE